MRRPDPRTRANRKGTLGAVGPQSTEPTPPARRRRGARIERYLFLVLEGARLEAGGMRVALAGVEALRIGRGDVRALVPAQGGTQALEVPDPRMSGTHAQIVLTGSALVLEDAGSTNGTLVNGEPIATHVLRNGDIVEIGQTIFLYCEIEDEASGRARSLDSSAAAALEPGFATLDPRLARSLERLARVAPSPLSILLLGETGTGKEVLARGLHVLSQRPGPFVAVNCGAIPQNLVEGHLFGHVRGAFSGALKDEPGLVRAAQYGTLLLDEIGDLPPSSQAALLRVLQESEVQPVGSAQTLKVDVRVIAATHMPLEDLIERGAFRRDLYARLAGYTFTVPPLRERRVDLGLLVAALLSAGKLGARRDVRMAGDAARAMVRHDWPMNVRELEQCLSAAYVLADDGVITAEDLPPAVAAALGFTRTSDRVGTPPAAAAAPAAPAAARPGVPAAPAAGADRRALIVALLAKHEGNLSAVARALRTSRSQVHRLMERYGIAGKPS
jgi:transcriptional regulator with GAF, ATPase, and Fis domain